MTKKKRFGVSPTLVKGMNDTIKMVEYNDDGYLRNSVVSVDQIELDPNNPRKLSLKIDEIYEGPKQDDPNFSKKNKEYIALVELSLSIQNSGLLHPLVLYKNGVKYRVIAGERRYLAIKRLGREFVDARIFDERPTGYKRKLVQWFENNSRVDIDLTEKLANIQDIIDEYLIENPGVKITVDELERITGMSRSNSANYLALLRASNDIKEAIQNKAITSLEKALQLNKLKDSKLRKRGIELCKLGVSLDELKKLVTMQNNKIVSPLPANSNQKLIKPGRKKTKVELGTTSNTKIIKKIIDLIVSSGTVSSDEIPFKDIEWNDYDQVTTIFKKCIDILEKKLK